MSDGIGRTRVVRDVMDPARATALHEVLGRDGPPPGAGDPLPPFFHHVYFWEAVPPAGLGRDGHPAVGEFIPDLGLPRRMWAGGRLRFLNPLRAGDLAERRSQIIGVSQKAGRSGRLAFVTLRHDLHQGGRLCLSEQQDLVYRGEATQTSADRVPAAAPLDSQPLAHALDSTMLFRYSALTFNGHRIHYDAAFARDVEGYPGLVVHGPLLAQFLMLRAAAVAPLRRFSYRGFQPLILGQEAVSNLRGEQLWVRNDEGLLINRAVAGW